jgi:hypothetical protein
MRRLEPGNFLIERYAALTRFGVVENSVAYACEKICLPIGDRDQIRLLDHFEKDLVNGVLSASAITGNREGEETSAGPSWP